MQSIRILVSLHQMPTSTHVTTILFENLLPILRKRAKVHVTWLVYLPDKLNLSSDSNQDCTILDIHDYKNAVEVVQKVKPDIIFGNEYQNLIDLAFNLAGKFYDIPVVTPIHLFFGFKTTRLKRIKSIITAFFQNSVYTDIDKSQKQVMRQGRFHTYKFLFLVKTMLATKMNILQIMDFFYLILKIIFGTRNILDSRCVTDLIQLDGELSVKPLLEAGFPRSNLAVVGNPIYDKAFKKLQSLRPTRNQDGKIHVLFVPHQLYVDGTWTKQQNDMSIREIVTKISQCKDEMSLVVKIHPSAVKLIDYQSIINPIDPSVPIFQSGDILDFLIDADVVISFPSTSTALIYALIARKPIILCNFFDQERYFFLENDLAVECKKPSDLIHLIHSAVLSNPVAEKIDDFIRDYLYKSDGCASERLCDTVINLLDKKYAKKNFGNL